MAQLYSSETVYMINMHEIMEKFQIKIFRGEYLNCEQKKIIFKKEGPLC